MEYVLQHILGGLYVLLPFICSHGESMPGLHSVFILFYTSVLTCVSTLIFVKSFKLRVLDYVFLLSMLVPGINLLFISTESGCQDYLTWVSLLLLYVIAREIRNNHIFFYYLICAGMIQGLYALHTHYYFFDSALTLMPLSGVFSNSAIFSIYITVAFIGSFGLIIRRGNNKWSILILIICILFLGMMIANSRSRASWLALFSGCFFLLWKMIPSFQSKIKQYIKRKPLLILLVLVLIIGSGLALYMYKMDSANGRLFIWFISLRLITQSPLIGSGISSFPVQYMLEQSEFFISHPNSDFSMLAGDNIHIFNEYLLIVIEQGILGLCTFSLVLYYYFKIRKNPSRLIGQAILISILIVSFFSYPFSCLSLKVLFVLLLAFGASDSPMVNKDISFSSSIRLFLLGLLFSLLLAGGHEHFVRIEANSCLSNRYNKPDSIFIYEANSFINKLSKDFDYLSALADFYLNRKNYGEALKIITLLSEIRTSQYIYCQMGICCIELGRKKEAEQYLLKAYNMIPSRVLPLRHLLNLYILTNQIDNANQIANKILASKYKVVNSTVLESKNEARQFLLKQLKMKGGEP